MLNIPLQTKCSWYSKRYPQGGGIVRVYGYSKKHLWYCAAQSRCVVVGTQKIPAILSIPLQTKCSWVLKKAPAILCGAESLCSCRYSKSYPQGGGIARVHGYSKRYPQGCGFVRVRRYSKRYPHGRVPLEVLRLSSSSVLRRMQYWRVSAMSR